MSKVLLAAAFSMLLPQLAHADDSDVCKRAKALMGSMAREASKEACQRAVDSAEEEDWQLWLDMALAAEQSGDREQAVNGYQRFVDAADARGARLGGIWAQQRDDARTTIARLDSELLQTKARVAITTLPPGAEVTVVGSLQAPGPAVKTPVVRYFGKGNHVVRLYSNETKAAREINFSVEVGQTLELKADLRPGAPTDYGVIEGTGPALRGQNPTADHGEPANPGNGTGSVNLVVTRDLPDGQGGPSGSNGAGPTGPTGTVPTVVHEDDGPPQTSSRHPILQTIGVAAIAIGTAALASGAVFLANGSTMDDEFSACTKAGSGCLGKAPALNALEHEADVQYTRATAAFITGGVLVVGGVLAVVLTDDAPVVAPTTRARPTAPTLARVLPWASPDGAGLAATLGF